MAAARKLPVNRLLPIQSVESTPISRDELRSVKRALAMCDDGEWGPTFEEAPAIVFEYSSWLATHPSMRDPESRRDFAKKFGLPTGLLNDIEEHPEFVRMHAERHRLAGFNRQTHNLVMENLVAKATSPYAKAAEIELFLSQTGTLKPKVAITLDSDDLSKMSDDELEREFSKLSNGTRLSLTEGLDGGVVDG